ncbi:hypothetical protein H0H92_010698 [Tricholoma furcatifolium]|nr:hypothetical protein H0H92_010698 [Tricholoma furcatifolium]
MCAGSCAHLARAHQSIPRWLAAQDLMPFSSPKLNHIDINGRNFARACVEIPTWLASWNSQRDIYLRLSTFHPVAISDIDNTFTSNDLIECLRSISHLEGLELSDVDFRPGATDVETCELGIRGLAWGGLSAPLFEKLCDSLEFPGLAVAAIHDCKISGTMPSSFCALILVNNDADSDTLQEFLEVWRGASLNVIICPGFDDAILDTLVISTIHRACWSLRLGGLVNFTSEGLFRLLDRITFRNNRIYDVIVGGHPQTLSEDKLERLREMLYGVGRWNGVSILGRPMLDLTRYLKWSPERVDRDIGHNSNDVLEKFSIGYGVLFLLNKAGDVRCGINNDGRVDNVRVRIEAQKLALFSLGAVSIFFSEIRLVIADQIQVLTQTTTTYSLLYFLPPPPVHRMYFPDENRRKINLGGATTALSHSTILSNARAQRSERLEAQKRSEAAAKLQGWYRGHRETQRVMKHLKEIFENDTCGLQGLRALVIIGRTDEDAVRQWCEIMASGSGEELFAIPRTNNAIQENWLVLIRQMAWLLLRAVAKAPLCSISHLQVLNALLSPSTAGSEVSAQVSQYLLRRDLYGLLARSISSIPLNARTSPALPHLTTLVTLPLSTVSSPASLLTTVFLTILTIPLLPNRLPAPSLTHLSSHIPFSDLGQALDIQRVVAETTPEQKLNLIANLQVFVPPRYKFLDSKSLNVYWSLLADLVNAAPIELLNPSLRKEKSKPKVQLSSTTVVTADSDSSDAEDAPTVTVVSTFSPPVPTPAPIQIDPRTQKRISTLSSTAHISSLLGLPSSTVSRPSLLGFLFALIAVWGADVVQAVLGVQPSLMREVYRGFVRGGRIGKDQGGGGIVGVLAPDVEGEWAPFLVLVELYTKAMVTMGDDEFFGRGIESAGASGSGGRMLSSSSSSSLSRAASSFPKISSRAQTSSTMSVASRNPLSLDELVQWSRQLMNVAFMLYWRGESLISNDSGIGRGPKGVRIGWEDVRERVTKCLSSLHSRDSRTPFVPQGHWLMTSHIDVQSFVEAAIYEEQALSSSDSNPTSPDPNAIINITPFNPRSQAQARSRARTQAYSKRALAHLSPRLGVLNNIPFAIPFDVRVEIFRWFVRNDAVAHAQRGASSAAAARSRMLDMAMGMDWMSGGTGRQRVQVRRGSVAQDGFDRLGDADLKDPVEIVFVDQFGGEEAGIDGGGVFKEFFTELCKEVFDTDRGLWLANTKNELYPNPHGYATESHSLSWYRFIGRILGKAMYEGILVDVAFAGFFLAKWLGRQSFFNLDDLASLDPELYSGLLFLKHYESGPVEDLSLNFSIAVEELGETKMVDLVPGGGDISVTKDNRMEYVQRVAHYKLSRQIRRQSEAFFEGVGEIIEPRWIRMFNQQEIQILIGGVNTPIDLKDLRSHTNYGGLYDDGEATIVTFWKMGDQVVDTFDQQQRMALLRFVTSCSRPPLLGFKELIPNFSIRDAGSDELRLPTSSTCVNLLKV